MTGDLHDAVARARDRCFAESLVMQIGLAAETHPEILREALSKLFDLRAAEENTKNMDRHVRQQWDKLKILSDRINILHDKISELIKHIDEAQYNLEQTVYGE